MKRLLFLLTLALYGFSVMEMHEWAHLPTTVVHWVEHHTDLGHHDEDTGHHHDEHGDHDPFGCDEHGACTTFTMVGMMQEPRTESVHIPVIDRPAAVLVDESALAAFSGSKWNPPKA